MKIMFGFTKTSRNACVYQGSDTEIIPDSKLAPCFYKGPSIPSFLADVSCWGHRGGQQIENQGAKGGGNARVCFEVGGCPLQELKVCENASTFSRRVFDQRQSPAPHFHQILVPIITLI